MTVLESSVVKYLRSSNFIIHFMAAWWVIWLALALTSLNIFRMPSWQVSAQFGAFIALFLVGHALALVVGPAYAAQGTRAAQATVGLPLRRLLPVANGSCLLVLVLSMYLSGAFTDSFIEYFAKLRLEETTGDSLTGSRLLDVATKALVFPIAYTLTLVALAVRIGPYRGTLVLSTLNIVLYAYLWQVNYPLMHLFWFFVFYLLVGLRHGLTPNGKTLFFVLALLALLIASAANRFGGDLLGGVQRYVFGYHLAGFTFYDHHYHDPASVLHQHTFGRSSLGAIEQYLEVVSRRLDLGFVASSSENATHVNESLDLGADETIVGNAFGTFLFGLYRDFNIVGVAIGALLYGALSTHALRRSGSSWACTAALYVLASAWMVGMMVNPIEQVHFWFAIVFLWVLSKANRGFRL